MREGKIRETMLERKRAKEIDLFKPQLMLMRLSLLCNMYQDESVHSSLFMLIIHPKERTLQWGCQHSKQWLLQGHTGCKYSDMTVDTSSRRTPPGGWFYIYVLCSHHISVFVYYTITLNMALM